MNWTVEWSPSAGNDLADLWTSGPDRSQLTSSADSIDRDLAKSPLSIGEGREGNSRILIRAPLAVEYDVVMDDHKVIVWHVWRWTALK
jgi:hypothetical protein